MDMLTSYNYEENEIVKSAIRKQELEQLEKKEAKQKHEWRTNIIKNYFLTMSRKKKIEFVLKLVENFKSLESMISIMHATSASGIKLRTPIFVDPETNFVYDKWASSHNRMLNEKALEQTLEEDFNWFLLLDPFDQQVLVEDLLRISGGSILGTLRLAFENIYRTKKEKGARRVSNLVILDKLENKMVDLDQHQSDDQFDPKHPASIDVRTKRKAWSDMINKYKKQVVTASIELSEGIHGEHIKKGSKNKESKGNKGKEEVDWLQVLPISIVKKICSFLDPKSIKVLQNVSSYWKFVCAEVVKEQKMRSKLIVTLEKLKSNIDPIKLTEYNTRLLEEPKRKTSPFMLNSIHPSIRADLIPLEKKTEDRSLFLDATKEIRKQEELGITTGEESVFPRIIKEDMLLYRKQPCPLTDIDILTRVEDDLKIQRSFLTYSLSIRNSMDITLETANLSEW